MAEAKPIIPTLSPELTILLKDRVNSTLARLVNINSNTTYFREAPLLSDLRIALQGEQPMQQDVLQDSKLIVNSFIHSVPLSTYDDYRPFINRLLNASPRLFSDVSNLLAPGVPSYVITSSGTTGGAAKFFPKYKHPVSISPYTLNSLGAMHPGRDKSGGMSCVIYNLRYIDVLDVLKDGGTVGEVVNRIPLCLGVGSSTRMIHGWNVDQDASLMTIKAPRCTSPLAASFIHSYQSALLMHALFALQERSLVMINTIFSTIFVDFIRLIEGNWDILVQAIDDGIVPKFDGVEEVYSYIQQQFTPNPDRAAELRAIGKSTESPGWTKRIWPDLKRVWAIGSGTFAKLVPQARHYVGPDVDLLSIGLACSESSLAHTYDPTRDLNLFSMSSDDFFEYLDLTVPESADNLKQEWELEVGKTYELIPTTRDGLWRYRLGDVIEVAGFNPIDGQPLVRYSSRRNIIMRATREFVTEKELVDAVNSLGDTLGDISEYTVTVDDRQPSRAYGFMMELKGVLGPEANSASAHLDAFLKSINTTYTHFRSSGHLGPPTIRILPPGAFRSYRSWKSQKTVVGAGQIKIPVVTLDDEVVSFYKDKVIQEVLSC